MTFNPNIPQPTDDLSDSQGQILTNFSSCNTSFGVNHYAFSDVTANNGKHKFMQMPQQVAAPVTAGNELALVAIDQSGETELCYRKPTNGAVIQLTGVDVVSTQNGTTFLPGGMILKWGTFTYANSTSTVVTFPIAFPNNCFSVQITVLSPPATAFIGTLRLAPTKTSFSAGQDTTYNGRTGYYMAIGN